jgi:hypothetical protein
MAFLFVVASRLLADQVEMQNGDRYLGRVLSVSADTVVFESEVLGKINVPRKKVASLAFGTNSAPQAAASLTRVSAPTNLPSAAPLGALANTNADLSSALRNLNANTNFIRQVREQFLTGSPEAGSKYDTMINGLLIGKLNLNDLRREAKSSADQLRALKRDLGPEADDPLDVYLEVLDAFLKEPTNPAPVLQPKTRLP